jgi:hypothetical protein
VREKGREVASTTEDSKMGECGWREREIEKERGGVHTIKE